jgi:hypothetical protein
MLLLAGYSKKAKKSNKKRGKPRFYGPKRTFYTFNGACIPAASG